MNILLAIIPLKGNTKISTFPSGIGYISSYMKKQEYTSGYKVFTANLNIINKSVKDFLAHYLIENNIKIFATSGLSREFTIVKEVIDIVKEINPQIIIWVGGGLITAEPAIAMQALEVADVGIVGEGEFVCHELAMAYLHQFPLDKVKGIIYKNNNIYKQNEKQLDIQDLDALPFPDYGGFGYYDFIKTNQADEKNTYDIVGSRSCPFSCTFCFHPSGVKYRKRSLENIFEEVEYVLKKIGKPNVYFRFVDELFASDNLRIIEFCRKIQKYEVEWECQMRVPDVNAKLLKIMKEAGCKLISFGIESADNEILKSMKKQITINQIEAALALTYEEGIIIRGNLIFGDTNETLKSSQKSLEWGDINKRYGITKSPIDIFPGTPIYNAACEKGIITDKVQFLKSKCPLTNVSQMTNVQYWDLVSLLYEDFFNSMNRVKKVKLLSFDKSGQATAIYKCIKCGSEVQVEFLMFGSRMDYYCPHCCKNQTFDLADFKYALSDNKIKVDPKLKDNGPVAFWGASHVLTRLIKKMNLFDYVSEKCYIIDIDPTRQRQTLSKYPILPPSMLNEKNIESVVITVKEKEAEIYNQIISSFPGVKNIFSLALETVEGKPVIAIEKRENL